MGLGCSPVDRHCWQNKPDYNTVNYLELACFFAKLLPTEDTMNLLKLGRSESPIGMAAIWRISSVFTNLPVISQIPYIHIPYIVIYHLVLRPVLSRSNVTRRLSFFAILEDAILKLNQHLLALYLVFL